MFDTDILKSVICPVTNINYSIYYLRCEDIEKQLKEYDIIAKVSRHTFKDTKYYVLNVDLNHRNSCMTVANALDIKDDEVHFIHINIQDDYKIFWISEDLLHARYLDGDGRLNFRTLRDQAIDLINEPSIFVNDITDNCGDITILLKRK